ncbi:MAG TPA: hypothetical protein VEU06_08685 [Micropepsaceae bacterium]|nr:hypothetical protein [Micropepsaceae bacterium]
MRLFLIGMSAVAVIAADFAVKHVSISDGTLWYGQIEMRIAPPQSVTFSIPPFETKLPDPVPDAIPVKPAPVAPTPALDNLPRERLPWNLDQYATVVDIKQSV